MSKARDLADRSAADLTAVSAGTGISVSNGDGPIPTVTNTVATGFDAKGDLIVGTGADTFAKLTVASTAGYLLSVDSEETTGLKWSAPAAGGLTVNWTTYTPSNTNVTVGNGTQTARYAKCGKTVFVSYRLVFGSTTSFGGAIEIGLPSTSNSFSNAFLNLTDNGTGNFSGGAAINAAGTTALVRGSKVDTTWAKWDDNVSNTSPFTWTNLDAIAFFITYEEQ